MRFVCSLQGCALVTTMYHDQPNIMTAFPALACCRSLLISIAVQPSRLTYEFMTKTEVFTQYPYRRSAFSRAPVRDDLRQ